MSLKTWKSEFYPTTASSCSKKNAVVHSLRKWIGLLPENLKRHGCGKGDLLNTITDASGKKIEVTCTTCALCVHFFDTGNKDCPRCPLAKATGESCFDEHSDYEWWLNTGNPTRMILSLTSLIKKYAKI